MVPVLLHVGCKHLGERFIVVVRCDQVRCDQVRWLAELMTEALQTEPSGQPALGND